MDEKQIAKDFLRLNNEALQWKSMIPSLPEMNRDYLRHQSEYRMPSMSENLYNALYPLIQGQAELDFLHS